VAGFLDGLDGRIAHDGTVSEFGGNSPLADVVSDLRAFLVQIWGCAVTATAGASRSSTWPAAPSGSRFNIQHGA
jgi:hypothetical protein